MGLLFVPKTMLREGTRLWRCVFEIDLIELLDSRRWIERFVYRHHKVFGAAVLAATMAFLFVTLRELYSHSPVIHWMSELLGNAGSRVAVVTIGALAAFILVIGLFLLLRPSALKGLESAANRWIALAPSARKEFINRFVLRMPRTAASLLLAAGIICLSVERY
jgi:hypothetical protein